MDKFFDKKKTGLGANANEVLAQELHKPLIQKFKRKKFYGKFNVNVCVEDLGELGSLSSGYSSLWCVIGDLTKCACAKTLKDKKVKKVLHGFLE